MTDLDEHEEPTSPPPTDRGDGADDALRDYLLLLGMFAAAVVVNGILALLLIELLRVLGWFEPFTPEGPQGAVSELLGRLRLRTALAN